MAELLDNLKPDAIKNTMDIRQLYIPSRGKLTYRNLSSYCSNSCDCYDSKTVTLKSKEQEQREPQPGTSKDPVIVGIEKRLTPQQKAKFDKRFEEGYDLVFDDLSILNEEEKQEYILWKGWRAAKFTHDVTHDDSNNSDDLDQDDNENPKLDPDWLPLETKFYAVVFLQRKSKKVTYIGRPTQSVNHDPNDEEIEMTFLERKMVGGEYKYDWPRRRDVCVVSRHAIVQEIKLEGPPPYHLTKKQITQFLKFDLVKSSSSACCFFVK